MFFKYLMFGTNCKLNDKWIFIRIQKQLLTPILENLYLFIINCILNRNVFKIHIFKLQKQSSVFPREIAPHSYYRFDGVFTL